MNVLNLRQYSSSEKSRQSLFPSHVRSSLTQRPVKHRNSSSPHPVQRIVIENEWFVIPWRKVFNYCCLFKKNCKPRNMSVYRMTMIDYHWLNYLHLNHKSSLFWYFMVWKYEDMGKTVASKMIIRKIGIATRNDNNAIIYANIVINVMNSNEADQVQDAYVFLLSVLLQ